MGPQLAADWAGKLGSQQNIIGTPQAGAQSGVTQQQDNLSKLMAAQQMQQLQKPVGVAANQENFMAGLKNLPLQQQLAQQGNTRANVGLANDISLGQGRLANDIAGTQGRLGQGQQEIALQAKRDALTEMLAKNQISMNQYKEQLAALEPHAVPQGLSIIPGTGQLIKNTPAGMQPVGTPTSITGMGVKQPGLAGAGSLYNAPLFPSFNSTTPMLLPAGPVSGSTPTTTPPIGDGPQVDPALESILNSRGLGSMKKPYNRFEPEKSRDRINEKYDRSKQKNKS